MATVILRFSDLVSVRIPSYHPAGTSRRPKLNDELGVYEIHPGTNSVTLLVQNEQGIPRCSSIPGIAIEHSIPEMKDDIRNIAKGNFTMTLKFAVNNRSEIYEISSDDETPGKIWISSGMKHGIFNLEEFLNGMTIAELN